jgi:hypothetical protein
MDNKSIPQRNAHISQVKDQNATNIPAESIWGRFKVAIGAVSGGVMRVAQAISDVQHLDLLLGRVP